MSRKASQGMVTAEAAIVLPVVALLALALVWLIALGVCQVQVVDAARDAARAIARGDGTAAAAAAARRTAGSDATVRIERDHDLVTVTVSVEATAPGWLLGRLPSVDVDATAQVVEEGTADGAGAS